MLYKIGGVVVFLGIIFGYYFFTQNKIENLQSDLVLKTVILKQAEVTLTDMIVQEKEQNQQINKLIIDLNNARLVKSRLEKLLRKHNLTNLSLKKPGLIQNKINNASKKLFNDIGDITSN